MTGVQALATLAEFFSSGLPLQVEPTSFALGFVLGGVCAIVLWLLRRTYYAVRRIWRF